MHRLAEIGERDHAEQRVELLAGDQEARVAAGLRLLPQRLDRIFDVEPDHVLARDHDRADLAVGERQHALDQAALGGEEHAGARAFRHQRAYVVFGHCRLRRRRDRQNPQDRVGRYAQQPDQRGSHLGEQPHHRGDSQRERLGVQQSDSLGHQLADDQRDERDDQHDDAVGDLFGIARRHAVADQHARQRAGEGRAAVQAGKDRDQGDADLDRRKQRRRVLQQRYSRLPPGPPLLGSGLQPGALGRHQRHLRQCEEAVEQDEQEDDDYFAGAHGGHSGGVWAKCTRAGIPRDFPRRV